MIRILMILMLFVTTLAFSADGLEIEVSPREPLLGESFSIMFKIQTSSNNQPEIKFETKGMKVVSEGYAGKSMRTTFFNGKLQTESTVNYKYILEPEKNGNVYLKDIVVMLDGKELKHKDVRVNILKKPKRQAPIFLVAEPSKEQVFLRESVVINYYLYYQVGLQNFTIEKFPKLDHFLKRYQPEQNIVDRVGVGNQVYQRRLLYSAQVFPEKTGKVKIDSMALKVQYANRGNNPFDNFGFNIGARSLQTQSINSETIYLEVLPLPTKNIPEGFTGLVGSHDFKLDINKDKFLLNEPLELKLKVTGPGALEKFDAPTILADAGLEEFDIKSDLELTQDYTGTKTFEYVYLTRAPLKQEAKEIKLAYFDPEKLTYVSTTLKLPAIEVVGQVVQKNTNDQDVKIKSANENFEDDGSRIIAPLQSEVSLLNFRNLNIAMVFIILIVFIIKNKNFLVYFKPNEKKKIISEILKDNLSYKKLIKLLKTYNQDFNSFKDYLKHSSLDQETKNYLLDVLRECEEAHYSLEQDKKKAKIKIKKKYFKKLIGMLEQ